MCRQKAVSLVFKGRPPSDHSLTTCSPKLRAGGRPLPGELCRAFTTCQLRSRRIANPAGAGDVNCHHRPDYEGRDNLARLDAELNRGRRVAPQDAPGDAITMNSQAQLIDLDTGEELTYTLVFPHAADIRLHKISILAPVGMAMFGYRIGDVFEWEVPAGLRRFKVKAVLYQPEAAENYDL